MTPVENKQARRLDWLLTLCCALFAASFTSGCATMTAPQTADQAVFATKALHATVAGTTADLLKSHVIDADTASEIYDDLQRTQGPIDAAVALARNGEVIPDDTLARINLIQGLLQKWQNRLLAKQAEAAQ